ncbi:MAG TPA: ERF family protein [Acidobacteriaceae bacterium]|nr:ERF family protein [Acidobacteriaceae bacterium]
MSEQEAIKMTLAGRLVSVMAETGALVKHGYNEQKNYSYATDADVLQAVREALARNGVLLLTLPGQVVYSEVKSKDGKPMTVCRLQVMFRFVDAITNESLEVEWPGEAIDVDDKATAKAITSGLKSFLLKTFLLPVIDDDADQDRRPRQQYRHRPGPPGAPPGVDAKTGEVKRLSDNQMNMLQARMQKFGATEEEILHAFNLKALPDMDNRTLDRVLKWLETEHR